MRTDRNWSAIFSDGFVLAERVYIGVSEQELVKSLESDGFEMITRHGEPLWAKECCGEYDAVEVTIPQPGEADTTAAVSVFDADVQFTWALFAVLGTIVAGVGVLILPRRPKKLDRSPSITRAEPADIQATA